MVKKGERTIFGFVTLAGDHRGSGRASVACSTALRSENRQVTKTGVQSPKNQEPSFISIFGSQKAHLFRPQNTRMSSRLGKLWSYYQQEPSFICFWDHKRPISLSLKIQGEQYERNITSSLPFSSFVFVFFFLLSKREFCFLFHRRRTKEIFKF